MASGMHYTDTRRNVSGIYIKKARENANLTKQKLSAKLRIAGLCISANALGDIERGKRVVGDYELKVFADVLDVPIFQLLGCESVLVKDSEDSDEANILAHLLLDTEDTARTGQQVYRTYNGRKFSNINPLISKLIANLLFTKHGVYPADPEIGCVMDDYECTLCKITDKYLRLLKRHDEI